MTVSPSNTGLLEGAAITPELVFNEIDRLFNRYGDEHYGEGVTQKQHMLQCAYFAEQENASNEVVVASLLHDIGHFLGPQDEQLIASGRPESDHKHEVIGARYLAQFFDNQVTVPIQLHVAAKRYLSATQANYFERLSEASKYSLTLQGGPMTEVQVTRFEQGAFFLEALKVRYYDDYGKQVGLAIPQLSHYKDRITSLVSPKHTGN